MLRLNKIVTTPLHVSSLILTNMPMKLETSLLWRLQELVHFSFLLLFILEHLSASGIQLEPGREMPKYYRESIFLGKCRSDLRKPTLAVNVKLKNLCL